jgi:hypothetical protein
MRPSEKSFMAWASSAAIGSCRRYREDAIAWMEGEPVSWDEQIPVKIGYATPLPDGGEQALPVCGIRT